MGALRIHARRSPTGRERKGVLEGDTAAPGAADAARPEPAAASRSTRSRRPRSRRERKQFSLRRGVSAARSLAADAADRDAGALRPAAGGSAARGLGADREAAHPQHHHGRARQGHGRPCARGRPGGFPGGVPRALSRDRRRRRAVGTPRHRARAPRRLHREPRAAAQPHAERDAVSGAAVRRLRLDRRDAADVRRAEDRQAVRELQGRAADPDAGADRDLRLPARLGPAAAGRAHPRVHAGFVRWLRDPAARRRFHAFLLRAAARSARSCAAPTRRASRARSRR